MTHRNQVQYLNAATARLVAGLQSPSVMGLQPSSLPSPLLTRLPGHISSPVLQANVQNLAGVPQLTQLPQATTFAQPSQPLPVSQPGQQRVSPVPMGSMAGLFGEQASPVSFCAGFEGSDVYIANQGVIVGRKEKRYVRIRWGDGQKGHKARWVGFAPSDWKMNRPLASDPQLLGFYVKPNLCDRSNKSKRNSGWVTLSIDSAHRAIKATIDGWTLGKVFIPTWLIGRVMRPVAVAETGMPVKFDLQTEEGCEKVLRAGFKKWSTINNTPLTIMRCRYTGRNFESDVLGMSLDVSFDEEENVAGVRDCEDGYISYNAVDRGLANVAKEVIPLVINDRHAFRVKERGLWELFWADERVPLDYLSERMTALIRKIYEAKHQNNKKLYKSAVTKLAHFRHILFFLAKDQTVVMDANSRVQWFLSNTVNSGCHREFTPDLGRLLTCVAVSDYEWEDIAVPFFAEALQRAIPHSMQQNPRVQWSGPNCCLEDVFDGLMTADKSLSEMLLHVLILTKVMKPHHKGVDEIVIERLSAEELCCGIASLSPELQILEYERSARKDEIKKCLIKREWQHEFSADQWKLIEGVLDTPVRLRGMLNRSRMIAECHGSCGLPTPEMMAAIDEAHELGKTVEDFKEYLECYNIAFPGNDAMFSIVKKAVVMATRKGYIEAARSPAYPDEEGLLSARQALSLTPSGSEILIRQGRQEPIFTQEVIPSLPSLSNQASQTSTPGRATPKGSSVGAIARPSGGAIMNTTGMSGEGEADPVSSANQHTSGNGRAGEPTPTQVTNYMQFPILMNNPSDPRQSFLVQATSPGFIPGQAAQFQYVQVPSSAQTIPGHVSPGSQARHQSPVTTPGSVRVVTTPTPDTLGHAFAGPNQLLLTQTPRNPTLPPPPNPFLERGESSSPTSGYIPSPTPMGVHQALVSPVAQHEGLGQPRYVLTYATSPHNGYNLVRV